MALACLLGPIEIKGASDQRIAPTGRKQRLLMATLLHRAPRAVSTDRLVDVLWGDDLPP